MAKRKKPTPHDDIDHKIRVNEKKEQIREVAGKEFAEGFSENCPPELREAFLDSVLAYEKMPQGSQLAHLAKDGLLFPDPAKLSDKEVSAELKKWIDVMAKRNMYLSSTNHLSDRELMVWLREEGLAERGPDYSKARGAMWGTSPIGSGSDEDQQIWLAYYATEKERKEHKKKYPEVPIPPRAKQKSNRDKTLPQWDPRANMLSDEDLKDLYKLGDSEEE
jgi:hypothetical protein